MSISLGDMSKMGMNYSPISSYNEILKNDFSNITPSEPGGEAGQFQNILDQQVSVSSENNIDPHSASIVGGVSVNSNFSNMNYGSFGGVENAYSTVAVSSASPVEKTANSFSSALNNGLNSLNTKQLDAQSAVETLASGGNISVHDVMIASQKASLNMQMAMQLRNKVLSAYNELYQMKM